MVSNFIVFQQFQKILILNFSRKINETLRYVLNKGDLNMFKNFKVGFLLLIGMFSLFPEFCLAQTDRISTQELKVRAEDNFVSGNYREAYKDYKNLLDRYPRDAEFNYYGGICLYKLDKDLNLAIEYLLFASSKSEVPRDVLYHLGKAYQKNYQFWEAKSAFQKFDEIAGKNMTRELNPGLEIQQSRNALQHTAEYNPFEIEASYLFTFSDSNYVRQVRGKGGQLIVKPADFQTRGEIPGEMTGYMFFPKNVQRGDYVYFSGYSRSRKQGSELFRIKNSGRQGWGAPEALSSLNTEQDEILPYFDPISNDLYFASRGHSSMGGFDIFKSHYDPERNDWSEPVNLGFPINSPDNEYLAMPGSDLGAILLITDRQGLDSLMTVYSLILKEPKKSLAKASPEELKKIGKLGGIAAISALLELEDKPEQFISTEEVSGKKTGKVTEKAELAGNANVSPHIASGLVYQKKSDSLSILAKEARIEVKSLSDANKRWELQRKIIEWEKVSKDLMEKANLAFAMENGSAGQSPKPEVPEAIEKDREVNGITVYKYKEGETQALALEAERKAVESKPESVSKLAQEAFKTANEPGEVIPPLPIAISGLNHFAVLEKSPYNQQNPFPVDIEIPSGAFYRIQLGVFSKDVSYDNFGGISPVTAESVPGKALTRFYAGKFNAYDEARKALEIIKQNGFQDAFIVSWYNGQKTALNKVMELEKRDLPQSAK